MAEAKKQRISAGILFYRIKNGELEYLLAHPGGPLYAKKDEGVWSIPKGEPDETESSLFETAVREAREETGITFAGQAISLGSVIQKGGKEVFAWGGLYTEAETVPFKSNAFTMEWPPKSGKKQSFPEVDKVEFFTYNNACIKIKDAQKEFLDRLRKIVLHEPLFDLSYLTEVAEGNEEFMTSMITKFIEQTEYSLPQMKMLINENKIDELRRFAHKLKPTFVIVGMHTLYSIMKSIEDDKITPDFLRSEKFFDEIQGTWNVAKSALESEIETLKGNI